VDSEQRQGASGGTLRERASDLEEIEALDLRVVTEEGETVSPEELRGKIFRVEDRDEPSGYVVKNMETTGEGTTLCYLQASSS
jgi:ribosomal protein S24E